MLTQRAAVLLLGYLLLGCRAVNSRTPEPLCCRLEGNWSVILQLDSAELYDGAQPRERKAQGTITFSRRYAVPWANDAFSETEIIQLDSEQTSVRSDTLHWQVGRYQIDFEPFWGGEMAPEPSITVLGGGRNALDEAVALLTGRDSLIIMLNPRVSHGGIGLVGAIAADSAIKGRWRLNGNGSRAVGRFEMRRVRH